ncbi:MAG: coenzyme F420-0:L-glutamate ligase [Candidatus Hermodarchaeota archaeon]
MSSPKEFSSSFLVHVLPGLGIIQEGDNVGTRICQASQNSGFSLLTGDILVIAQTIVSRAEGRTVNLTTVTPSKRALELAQKLEKRPELVEVILQASQRVVRAEHGHLIVETPHGFVCANAGVDSSNVPNEDSVTLLPKDPDRSAEKIRQTILELCDVDVAVIISDTHGRPFREGAINVAIGTAGLIPMKSYIGLTDLFGYELRSTKVAVADELASAAELLMGEADEGNAVIIIRGYSYEKGMASARMLVREAESDIFRR